jgi:hypothetical protein
MHLFQVDRTGFTIIVGFQDGTMRVVVVSIKLREMYPNVTDKLYANVIQVMNYNNFKFMIKNKIFTLLNFLTHNRHSNHIQQQLR